MNRRTALLGATLVTIVALGKTALASLLITDDGLRVLPVFVAMFIGFFILTGAVALLAVQLLKQASRSGYKLGVFSRVLDEPGKENLLEMRAREWGLSKAETEVAIFVVKGFSNAEIAEMRGSALSTIKSQLGSIYQKSGLENRYQLMAHITDDVIDMAKTSGKGLDKAYIEALRKSLAMPPSPDKVANINTTTQGIKPGRKSAG